MDAAVAKGQPVKNDVVFSAGHFPGAEQRGFDAFPAQRGIARRAHEQTGRLALPDNAAAAVMGEIPVARFAQFLLCPAQRAVLRAAVEDQIAHLVVERFCQPPQALFLFQPVFLAVQRD